jgi:hypothetical protein
MSDQMYCRAWASAVFVARTKRMQHASDATMRTTDSLASMSKQTPREPHCSEPCRGRLGLRRGGRDKQRARGEEGPEIHGKLPGYLLPMAAPPT